MLSSRWIGREVWEVLWRFVLRFWASLVRME